MKNRIIGEHPVSSIGLGCMNLSHAYGTPVSSEQAQAIILRALDLGVTHFDTATLYGFGANETLLGQFLSPFREQIFLASKCGLAGVEGKRVLDGRPEVIKAQCDASLKRLNTDRIDLYYLHRRDKKVPIEDSVGALADLVHAGKVRYIGLSEVSVATLEAAHAIHPITAVQNEYSLWTRNPELGMLRSCQKTGTALVAFSPLGRGFLANALNSTTGLTNNDIRKPMPRFNTPHWQHNVNLLRDFVALAQEAQCTPAQLALGWLLAQGEHVLPIPGTTQLTHLVENCTVMNMAIDGSILQRANQLINQNTVSGDRYPEATLQEIDSEAFEKH